MTPQLIRLANAMAQVDVAYSTSTLVIERGYTRPIITENSKDMHIIGGRHPVLEMMHQSRDVHFVCNDCRLTDYQRLWLITGPNMGGKSTFLRQTAIIVILAQAGLYVHATEAKIGLVDRIFSRLGSADNLVENKSTFMVEMEETSAILKDATSKSLVSSLS